MKGGDGAVCDRPEQRELKLVDMAERRSRRRVAEQIAPLIESVPPRFYGGTERTVSYLTEELMALGHDVTTA